ncbi:MAG TPA: helix-turn-helix transcriptional regulator [Jiangellaceae bacterium]
MADRRANAPEDLGDVEEAAPAIGRRIQIRRLKLGLTQAEVAAGMLSPSYLSLVESGRRQPAESALEHIANQLGVDAGYLRDGIDAEARRRARLGLGQAEVALQRGAYPDAHKRFVALEVDPGLTDEQQRQARLGRARAAQGMGDLDEAIEILREQWAAALRDPAVNPWLDVATALARCYSTAGDIDLAVQVGERAMQDAVELGLGASVEYIRLGRTVLDAYHDRGDLAAASRLAADLVARADEAGSASARGAAYATAAAIAESRGQIAQALSLTDRALALLGDGDDQREIDRLRVVHAGLLLEQDPSNAARALQLVDDVYAGLSDGDPTAEQDAVELTRCETERARALLALDRCGAARSAAEHAVARLDGHPRPEGVRARVMFARTLFACGEPTECLDQCKQSAAALGELGNGRATAAGWRELGSLYRDAGHAGEALDAYERALAAARIPSR